jgi:Cdc6-like AAA superfamily ATPase
LQIFWIKTSTTGALTFKPLNKPYPRYEYKKASIDIYKNQSELQELTLLNLIDITTADGTHIKFKDTGSDSSYLFITGDNGCGKSTILKNVLTNFINIHPKRQIQSSS